MAEPRVRRAIGWVAVGAVAVGGLVVALREAERLPAGPEPVAWQRATCERCRMLVGDPAFAAQLQTAAGAVLQFDDPGCLLRYEAEVAPEVHAIWFRHLREPRWVPRDRVRFLRVEPTPMGYGLGAVEDAGELSYAEAQAWAESRDAERNAR